MHEEVTNNLSINRPSPEECLEIILARTSKIHPMKLHEFNAHNKGQMKPTPKLCTDFNRIFAWNDIRVWQH